MKQYKELEMYMINMMLLNKFGNAMIAQPTVHVTDNL